MKLLSTVVTTALGNAIQSQLIAEDHRVDLGADVVFTPYQLAVLTDNGIDTDNYPVDESLPAYEGPIEFGVGVDLPWQAVWRNPSDYNGDGVIIPYRFQPSAYTNRQMADIEGWLAELSEYLGGCVKFVNDTGAKKYTKDYIYVRSMDDSGVYYKGVCNSYIGNITKYYKMENQELKLSVAQPDYRSHCLYKATVQHEFMHALGFNHEQNRPDRDQFIDVHMENVIPSMQHNFDRMKTEEWEDMGEVYDLKSTMHYDGNAFLTQEAAAQGLSSMTYKGTNERVVVNSARATSIDVVQIAKRYHDFCSIPSTKFCPTGEYYLDGRDCDGVVDCDDGSDEQIEECAEYNCGKTMKLTSQKAFGGTLDFQWVDNEYIGDKPYWYNTQRKWYLYHYQNDMWYIHSRPGNNAGFYYGYGVDACPTGRDQEWFMGVNGKWENIDDFTIRGE